MLKSSVSMGKTMETLFALFVFLLVFGSVSHAYAHTTVDVAQYSIEVGWGIEPPVVSYRNLIVFDVSQRGDSEGGHYRYQKCIPQHGRGNKVWRG